ncbi:MAG TPA: DUF2335 domain-containing protein [Rudaea sp.]|uniref:DUF2335 domain-containing protein n=1 Tax=Rudaea sp. TaxID=2136325 RepID=UPI002F95C57E
MSTEPENPTDPNPQQQKPDKPVVVELSELPASIQARVSPAGDRKTQERTLFTIQKFHRGPLPDPETLAGYNQVEPGLANRIVVMAESHSLHYRKMQSRSMWLQAAEGFLGQIFAFLIVLAFLFVGGYLTFNGYPWAGGFSSTIGLGTIVTAFILGRDGSNSAKPDSDESGNGRAGPLQKKKKPRK